MGQCYSAAFCPGGLVGPGYRCRAWTVRIDRTPYDDADCVHIVSNPDQVDCCGIGAFDPVHEQLSDTGALSLPWPDCVLLTTRFRLVSAEATLDRFDSRT